MSDSDEEEEIHHHHHPRVIGGRHESNPEGFGLLPRDMKRFNPVVYCFPHPLWLVCSLACWSMATGMVAWGEQSGAWELGVGTWKLCTTIVHGLITVWSVAQLRVERILHYRRERLCWAALLRIVLANQVIWFVLTTSLWWIDERRKIQPMPSAADYTHQSFQFTLALLIGHTVFNLPPMLHFLYSHSCIGPSEAVSRR